MDCLQGKAKRTQGKTKSWSDNNILPSNPTLNSNKYRSQIEPIKGSNMDNEKFQELADWNGVDFHQDNANPRVSLQTRQKLVELGWNVLLHTLHPSDPVYLDYHLFGNLQNNLKEKDFN